MSERTEEIWELTRRRIAIGSMRFLMGISTALLLYGMFYEGGIARLEAMKEIIYTIGGTFSLVVTGYVGVDAISRLRGNKTSKAPANKEPGEG